MMLRKFCISLVLLLPLWLITACSEIEPGTTRWASYNHVNTASLKDIQGLKQETLSDEDAEEQVSPIRLMAIKEAAMTLGAQGALANRSETVNKMLTDNRQTLEQAFNFYPLVLEHGVLPPVLVEGRQNFNLDNNETIRIADQSYRIVQPARFISSAPNWRSYLWLDYPRPDVPDPSLLPKPDRPEEIKAWRKYVAEGWEQGLEQANAIFDENLARLTRDYRGMALYKKLLLENMISAPIVAKTELGITGGGNQMSINDRLKRITAQPGLIPDGKQWKPGIGKPYTSVAHKDPGPMKLADLEPEMHVQGQEVPPHLFIK